LSQPVDQPLPFAPALLARADPLLVCRAWRVWPIADVHPEEPAPAAALCAPMVADVSLIVKALAAGAMAAVIKIADARRFNMGTIPAARAPTAKHVAPSRERRRGVTFAGVARIVVRALTCHHDAGDPRGRGTAVAPLAGVGGWLRTVLCAVVVTSSMGVAAARTSHTAHHRGGKAAPPEDPGSGGGAPAPAAPNAHFAPGIVVALPGRGAALAWAPDGQRVAVGGHFRDAATGLRYDTRIVDVAQGTLTKSYSCHYYWVIATAWATTAAGEIIADGGGDHMVKLWDAGADGSTRCRPGQFPATDGAVRGIYQINGWITGLAFSPDGRFLAGTSRDRTVRIWSVAPGPSQGHLVALWYDAQAGNFLSVAWAPDGRHLATGDRLGRVSVWSFDPDVDQWSDGDVARFEKVAFALQPLWFSQNHDLVTRAPVWSDGNHVRAWKVAWSPDATRVAATGSDGLLSVLDAATGAPVYRVGAPRVSALHGLDWSPDGTLLAAGAANRNIYVFDAATGALFDTLEGSLDIVTAVRWSPDGSTLASTAGGQLLSGMTNQVVQGPDQAVRLWTRR
jgi:WD40 repeat protein